jgi:hypothetical protein
MLSPAAAKAPRRRASPPLLPLENGERLTVGRFLARFEAMTDTKKAELIDGIVYMPSPVRADRHGEPDSLIQFWLGCYAMVRGGVVKVYSNTTLLLDSDNCAQPDVMLCSTPRAGHRVWLNAKGYLCGAPELVCEIAASSTALDLHGKLHAYRRRGVSEYLVWLTAEDRFVWYEAVEGEFVALKPDGRGRLHSRIFPGLVLDTKAALAGQRAKVLAALKV